MGIYRKDYLVYGWLLPYNVKGFDFWDEKHLPYIEGHKDVKYTLIRDCMSTNYLIFGKIIKSADEHEGWNFIEIPTGQIITPFEIVDMCQKYRELFNVSTEILELVDKPKLILFSHFN